MMRVKRSLTKRCPRAAIGRRRVNDLAGTIDIERDGPRDMLEAVAVSAPRTDAKVKGTVPPVGALGGLGRDRTGATDARRRPAFTNWGL
jgi:hypothetical protein